MSITPYLWAAGISGDVGLGVGPGTSVDASFDDVLDNLEAGLMLAVEGRVNDEIGLLGDVTWMELGKDGTRPITGADVEGRFDMVHSQLSVTWRPPGQERVIFDVLGGLRVIDLEARLQTGAFDGGQSDTFFDPVVGLRSTIPIAESFEFLLHGDIGGFGVGTDLSYQLAAIFGYTLSRTVAFGLGYRHLGVDIDEPDLEMDVAFSGPVFGLRITF